MTDMDHTEDMEGSEHTEGIEDMEDIEDTKNTEDVEDIEDIDNMEDIEDIENIEDMEDTENIEDMEDLQQLESNEDERESDEGELESNEDERESNKGKRESDEETSEGRSRVPFPSDVENVEFPVSWRAGMSEVAMEAKVHTEYVPHFRLFLIGDELCDEGSTSAAGTGVHTVVCETLPEGLVEEVLLRLPAAAQTRCRAVSNAMLSNPEFHRRSFLQALSRTTPPLCALIFCPTENYNRGFNYRQQIPPLFKSLKLDLSFLPGVFHASDVQLHNCSPCGFMCIGRLANGGMHLCVVNPVNQSFKVLPVLEKLMGYHYVYLSMGTVTATETIPSFKVYVPLIDPTAIAVCDLYKDFAIYSSISGEWKGFLGGHELERWHPPTLACNGEFYKTVDSTPPRLVRLSTEKGPRYLWDVALPYCDERCDFSLLGYRGRLLCCCNGIWMLDEGRHQWVVIAGRCPPDILPPCTPKRHILTLHSVDVAGDLVVFFYQCFRCSDESAARGDLTNVACPVAFDMRQRLWRKVPQVCLQLWKVFQPMPNLRL